MVDEPLSLILRRLESSPPTITRTELGSVLQRLEPLGLLRQAEPARALPCPECDGSRQLPVEFIKHKKTGQMHGYIACPECGSSEIDPRKLERWRIDSVAVLRAIMEKLTPTPRAPTEVFPSRLWNAGKIHLLGQLREIFFIVGFRTATGSAVVDFVRTRAKCIILMPCEIGVARWGAASNNLVLAIDSFATLEASGIEINRQVLETRVAAFFGNNKTKTPPKRRASRLADLDALERELTEHLRNARDHAIASRDLKGEAKLLRRPTKAALAKRAGVSPSDLTRCFQDKLGANLRRMWELAADLDAIIGYRED